MIAGPSRAVILCGGETFLMDETWLQRASTQPVPLVAALVRQERKMIEAVLEESRGRISGPSRAAGKLGRPGTTLESKIKSLRMSKHRLVATDSLGSVIAAPAIERLLAFTA